MCEADLAWFLFSTLQALAWWEPLESETQLLPGAEGEEGEVVEGAGASIMVEAMAKEVKHTCAVADILYLVAKS